MATGSAWPSTTDDKVGRRGCRSDFLREDDDDRDGGGHVPSALGLGDGGGFRSPMAIAVIGGLIMSTMLSRVFVPAGLTVLVDVCRVGGRRVSRFVGSAEDPNAPAPAGPALAVKARPAPEVPIAAE